MASLRLGHVAVCLWVCVAVFVTSLAAAHVTATTSPSSAPPCMGDNLLRELQGIQKTLKSMQRGAAQQPSWWMMISTVGCGSTMGLIMNKVLAMESEQKATQAQVKSTQDQLKATQDQLKATQDQLNVTQARPQVALHGKAESGSSFVRWGRKKCTNSSQLVYTGVAGGSWYNHAGAAVDLLCLTMTPQFEESKKSHRAYIYGAEYEHITNLHDHDVPCSVCRAFQASTIMVPGTHACPLGWTTQYAGHLVAGYPGHKAATEYTCLDTEPQSAHKGHEDNNGRLLYYVGYYCGSLPCPPFVQGKTALCVVCSK